MNYSKLTKVELIKLLNERDEFIAKLESKTDLRKDLLQNARELKEKEQEKRVKSLKSKIKEIIAEKKEKLSIRELCKVLEINRQTLYNNNLNEFYEQVLRSNFLIFGTYNPLNLEISKIKAGYNVSISDSSLVFADSRLYTFSDKVELKQFLNDFVSQNEFRIIISELLKYYVSL